LTITFFILWHAHHLIYDLGNSLADLKTVRNTHEPRLIQSNQSR